ncbi:MAG: amidophosphoribosyltransferase [Candidatus Fischerbacteria bacterium RBG_13_37_8]|uniref:Amidophosphoribosyltransferase n=1 Tax=Candidatus Fischerbacteria bacterium RBG_13_37_8 TaxID=1817863 RepID=A0A1F5V5L5_9BACT|nr:MAG: amidophosphoribosyltransferase [Candidatus Fischerbacteria bacterium RBG_13_37_8]
MCNKKEYCGLFGVFNVEKPSDIIFLGLYSLQHRGQESAGIAISDGTTIYSEKGMGHVADVFTKSVFEKMQGNKGIGHVRYSTAGESLPANAQPIIAHTNKGHLALVHNGNLVNSVELRHDLERTGSIFATTTDSETILHLLARSKADRIEEAIIETLHYVKGAYCFLILTNDKLFAIRDGYGFRPLSLGKLHNSYILASETCAFDILDAKYIRDIEPGEILTVSNEGMQSIMPFAPTQKAYCIFELIYFARPDSYVFGRNVNIARIAMGKILARESSVKADIVVPVPDSGLYAALGFAEESKIPFQFGLTRNHYIGRTFIQPKQSVRSMGVKVKLNPVKNIIQGKKIILIDDSIVRGTTSKKIVTMLYEAGAKEVHMKLSSPPMIGPCYYGIDTPFESELIAANLSIPEIRQFIGCDSIQYLSLQGLLDSVNDTNEFCTACFTHNYPIKHHMQQFQQLRLFEKIDPSHDHS